MTGNSLDRRRVLVGSAATALSSHALAQTSSGQLHLKRPSIRLLTTLRQSAIATSTGAQRLKLTIREDRGRWYLYTGHFWHRGWSVIDVTDPTKPEVVNFIEGPRGSRYSGV